MSLESFYSNIQDAKIVGMSAFDLGKAFDTVNHKHFLEKLHLGISDISLKWLSSYHENRAEMACINGSVSDCHPVLAGVLQGSILGPLLFIIYMTDLPNCTTNIYANDTAICVSARNKAEMQERPRTCLSPQPTQTSCQRMIFLTASSHGFLNLSKCQWHSSSSLIRASWLRIKISKIRGAVELCTGTSSFK